MKKIIVLLPLLFLFVFVGASCDNKDTNSNDNENTNQAVSDQDGGDFSEDIPQFTLDEGETIDQGTEDGSWDTVNDDEESTEEEALSEDEWKGDPMQVIYEFFFKSHVSGEAKNQSHRVTGLQADLTGIIVVYQDGSIGGTGNIVYAGTQDCEIVDPASQSLLSCEYDGSMDGTFNITGNVVEREPSGRSGNEWVSDKYWLDLMFLEAQQPYENLKIVNNISGNSPPVVNKDLHLVLYSGLFAQGQLMQPYLYESLYKQFSNSYATSDARFEFVSNTGSAEFQVLREEMGLTLQP